MGAVAPHGPVRVLQVGSVDSNGTVTGVATGNAKAPLDCDGLTNITVYVKASAALSDGTVVIEERDVITDVAGTIATITLATPFASTGGTYAYHLQTACYGLVNARIGTDVVGGTIIVTMRAC